MTIFDFCEKMPEFPGGDSAFLDFLLKNINFTKEFAENSGRIYISLVVEKMVL
jgi:hypothetical protein